MRSGPLVDLRVVELGAMGPAPFACMLLADLGADVVKIDRPGSAPLGVPADEDLVNRGRTRMLLDLKRPDAVAVVRRLVSVADVFVEGFRPGVAERLGLGPDDLLATRPTLVYGRMTGWGQSGPRAQEAGHDINFVALSGVLGAIGGPDRPSIPLNLLGDYGGGALYLAVGILAALCHARKTGQGQVVDAAIVDGVTHLATQVHGLLGSGRWQDRRSANLIDGGTPFYDVYETRDGGYLAVGPLEPRFFAEFEQRLGLPEPLPDRDDRSRWHDMRNAIASRIRQRTRAEWTAVFAGSDACVTPVLSLTDAPTDPHLRHRGSFIERGDVVQPAPAPRFSATPTGIPEPPSTASAERSAVLRAWGLTP